MDYDYESPWIDGVTDPEEIRRRITGDMPPPIPTPEGGWTPENIGPEIRRLTEASRPIVLRVEPYDLTAEPKTYVLVQPGWGERLAELAPRIEAEYCNVCGNFPCLGGHPGPAEG